MEALETKTLNHFILCLRESTTKAGKPFSDRYINLYARSVKTFFRFCYEEKYISELPNFKMPKIRKAKLLQLDQNQIPLVMGACDTNRDLAIMSLAIASGLRQSELISLNWGNINLRTGRIEVLEGKGKKYRITKVDKQTLRVIIKYHNELKSLDSDFVLPDSPLFQTDENKRIKTFGLRSIMNRISTKAGVKFTAHALRRTFAKMAVKNGMDIIWLQELMGHSQLE